MYYFCNLSLRFRRDVRSTYNVQYGGVYGFFGVAQNVLHPSLLL